MIKAFFFNQDFSYKKGDFFFLGFGNLCQEISDSP